MRAVAAFVLGIGALRSFPAGCRHPSAHEKGRDTMTRELHVTAVDNGQTRTATVGQDVLVQLEETPSTGYLWTLQAAPPEAVLEVGSEWLAPGVSASAKAPPGVGGGGLRRFHLRLLAPGEVRLGATLARPWESGATPLARYDVTLQVKSE